MERRIFSDSSDFIRAICKTNAEPGGLRLTTHDFSTRACSSQDLAKELTSSCFVRSGYEIVAQRQNLMI